MTIKIRYNNEFYEIIDESRRNSVELCCTDYSASIADHVQNIIEVLAARDVAYVLEEL